VLFLPKSGQKGIRDSLKILVDRILTPTASLLNKYRVSPNTVTLSGFALNIPAAVLIAYGLFIPAGLVIFFAGIFDLLDGVLARKMGKITVFGGFLDSTVDRLTEGVLFFGILVYYLNSSNTAGALLAYAAMFFSFLISYIRARAGSLKINCEEGLLTRGERISILILGLLFQNLTGSLFYAVIIIAIFSFITVLQRIAVVYKRSPKPAAKQKSSRRIKK